MSNSKVWITAMLFWLVGLTITLLGLVWGIEILMGANDRTTLLDLFMPAMAGQGFWFYNLLSGFSVYLPMAFFGIAIAYLGRTYYEKHLPESDDSTIDGEHV